MNNNVFFDKGVKRSDTVAGCVAIAVYLLFLLLIVLFVKFSVGDEFVEKNETSGILLNFGDETLGYGAKVTKESSASQNIPEAATESQEAKKINAEATSESVENDHAEDAVVAAVPEVKKKVEKPKVKVEKKKETVKAPKAKPTPKAEPAKPVVNTGALYKKRTGSGDATSDSNASHGSTPGGTGKTGSKDGQLGAAGNGGSGSNFSLSGRSLIGALSQPQYDERVEGKITIEIQVNREGKVTSAIFQPKNSTISSRTIIESVRSAAMKTRFNADQKAAFTQVGTITYILKVE